MTEQQAPAIDPRPLATSARVAPTQRVRSTYGQLVSRGLDPNEAANLTAFINGIAVGAQPWSVNEVSHLLFLRELYRIGRIGRIDGDDR
jgi:hypothetical protein